MSTYERDIAAAFRLYFWKIAHRFNRGVTLILSRKRLIAEMDEDPALVDASLALIEARHIGGDIWERPINGGGPTTMMPAEFYEGLTDEVMERVAPTEGPLAFMYHKDRLRAD
jgi:hypothetical protein